MRYATSEMVTNAWLATLPGITAAMVGQTLPSDNSTWAASGFITPFGAGGAADVYLPEAHPVMTCKCWAVVPDSGLPPWTAAAWLAEAIRAGCNTPALSVNATLALPYSDQAARLMSAYLKQEPRRAYGDTGDYACYVVDVQIHWVAH